MEQRTNAIRLPQSPYYGKNKKDSIAKVDLKGLKPHTILMAFLILMTFAVHILIANNIKKMDAQIRQVQQESARLNVQHTRLLKEEKNLKKEKNLKILGKKMGLHPPGATQLIRIKGGQVR
jgi:hypothetical protein